MKVRVPTTVTECNTKPHNYQEKLKVNADNMRSTRTMFDFEKKMFTVPS